MSCLKKTNQEQGETVKVSDRLSFTRNGQGVYIVSGTKRFFLPQDKIPLRKVVLLNSSLIGYWTELGIEDRIVGVVSPQYIYSDAIHQALKSGKITQVGSGEKINIEKIISLAPDAVFTNYVPTQENIYSILKSNGIEVVFLDEYLEQNPLNRTAYILLFGALTDMDSLAKNKYEAIEKKYWNIKQKTIQFSQKPFVMANEMYGNIWYMPGGKTILANFIKDAGGRYILEDYPIAQAVSFSFEKALVLSQKANVWVNVGNYVSKKELLSFQPQYRYISAFQQGRVYSLQKAQKGEANNFFEEGNVRSDLVLKDYAKILHPSIFPKDTLRYLHELK